MASRFVKLVMVTEGNNNKYYEMTDSGGSTFAVKYGRVESTAITDSYPIHMWQKKYDEKIKKGYKDVTHTVMVEVKEDDKPTATKLAQVGDDLVDKFLAKMKAYTDGLVAKTYSVKAVNVSQAQVDEAQGYIDAINKELLAKKVNPTKVNILLLDLYTVIPRYMSKVPDHLLPKIDINKVVDQEQDNLDAMASQVKMYKKETAPKKATKKPKEQNLLDVLGVTMKECTDKKDIEYLLKQVQTCGRKVKGVFDVQKAAEDKTFDAWMKGQKNKQTKILIHGTKCTSVIPIMEIGLKIRPKGNFQFSGKAYGDGNYFSEVVQKSLGYTGWDDDSVLFVYEVHTGNPFVYDGWFKGNSFALNYKELQTRGYDSTYVKAGGGLLNSEIIAYQEPQCRLKGIIWLGK